MDEAELGYPNHKIWAIGHLAEAESEVLSRSREFAKRIREIRKAYMDDICSVNMEALVESAMELYNEDESSGGIGDQPADGKGVSTDPGNAG